ncbi:hypothetical protein SSX86_021842 [Deinandra increscens subsp. villosa]|uniref:Trehalose 6-phosphate phosphatase n=1 Tax=Deinandra increscens subsp. villosa TaxID=3103831 RepID=A0AAP0CRJ0_9ASTR
MEESQSSCKNRRRRTENGRKDELGIRAARRLFFRFEVLQHVGDGAVTDHKVLPPLIEAQKGAKWIFQVKNGERFGGGSLKFTVNGVFKTDESTPPSLTATGPSGKDKLCITYGRTNKARKELFPTEDFVGSDLCLTSETESVSEHPVITTEQEYSSPKRKPLLEEVSKKKPGKFDDVRSNGWLDAMQSSSPPRKKKVKDIAIELASDETDVVYYSWMLKYPSALKSFHHIVNRAHKKKIVIFLDYDGTLSPIVDDPNRAFMSIDMHSAVKGVAKYFPTAIISGRSCDKVYELVGLTEISYAGSHGMDIIFPAKDTISISHTNYIRSTHKQGKKVNLFQPAREFIPVINEVFRILVEVTKDIPGAFVENHKFCTSVHYRNVDEKVRNSLALHTANVLRKRKYSIELLQSWPIIAQRVHDVLKDYPRLILTHGRKVLEIRPLIDWDKGKAVEFLLESLGLSNINDVLPIYIGDDRTDEDAFKVLREGNRGYGILVSSVPKESKAFFSLRDTFEVKEFLKSLVKWKEQMSATDK